MSLSSRFSLLSLAAALILAAGGWFLLAPRTVTGVVTDANGPIAGATVRLRATAAAVASDAEGRFTLTVRGFPLHRTVTAWAAGYYIGAADLTGFANDLQITLRPHTDVDHPGMAWLPSGADPAVELACGNCHADLVADWQASAHANAAANPLVQAMYHGVDAQSQAGVGPGFRLDEPEQPGNCAFCHAPAAADLGQLAGEAANGVFCQFCHSIAHAQQPYAETTAGVQAIGLLRPPPGEHLFIGPFDDVPGRDTYSALQTSSQFCAACHSGSWWNVPTYTSFDEWQASSYAAEGVQCQDCHMAPAAAPGDPPVHLVSACAPAEPGPLLGETLCRLRACIDCHLTGAAASRDPTTAIPLIPARDPATISSHRMPGAADEAFLRGAVALTVTAQQGEDGVLVEVDVANVGAGHHIPTDGWMRNMILLVEASDGSGRALEVVGEQVLPEWATRNNQRRLSTTGSTGNKRMAGKGFARVLEDWEGVSPAPPWRNGVRVRSDTRIAANASDRSTYAFALPGDGRPATVRARLIYRRLFAAWAEEKGFDMGEVLLVEATVTPEMIAAPLLAARAPVYDAAAFAPSSATTTSGQRLPDHAFPAPAACGACHPAELAAWSDSAHAQAAARPFYRAWFKMADQRTNGEIGPFCAGCHTPIGLFSGQIRSRWGWKGQEQSPLSPAAAQGVTCALCHGIVALTGEANGAYVLDPARLDHASTPHSPLSDLHSPLSNLQSPISNPHSPPCAACHEATNPASGLPVMTTVSEWQASPYAADTACVDCHPAHGQPAQKGEVVAVEILPPADASPGQDMEIRVRVRNIAAGHSLPTGASELRQLWLEMRVTDAAGRELYHSGGVDDFGDPLPGSVTYGVVWQDADGHPTDRLWEAERLLRDHRLPAAGAMTERFRFSLPADVVGPLQVQARLQFRRAGGYLTELMGIYLAEAMPPNEVEVWGEDALVVDGVGE